MTIERVVVIVLDGVGVGELPDADEYGDVGSNSIANTARVLGGLELPNMQALGLGNLSDIPGVPPRTDTLGAYGKMAEISKGKDSVTGHWELMGLQSPVAMPTYPNGFPPEVLEEFTRRTGYGVLGNKPASGTEIIQELGEEHLKTGKLIVYTSADSVFQIAAHEGIVPIAELYRVCQIARDMLSGPHAVGRVIARPFEGEPGAFKRTPRRHDYPLLPPRPTVMMKLVEAGFDVAAVGKIDDLFGNTGITRNKHTTNNRDSIAATLEFLPEPFKGLLLTNLIEYDMIYGHRNDPRGYAGALRDFDAAIPTLRAEMHATDIAMIVADHGVDPTTPSTDHSREYIPLLVFGEPVKPGVNLGIRSTFADVGATIAEIFGLEKPEIGVSFLQEIRVK
ncbi:MAG TPA: phosphopentomutase [Anaerolineae bacterium]|nr:phosphopentomutase [Anaerolineae bacterium]